MNSFFSNRYFVGGMLAVTGAFMVSCSSDTEGVEAGGSRESAVKTQFSISVPYTGSNAGTRMSDGNTQTAATAASFLGMQDITLIPYALSSGDVVGGSLMDRGLVIKLANIAAGTAGLDQNTNSAKVYNDVEIEIGTSNFLFYSQAIRSNDSDVKSKQGSLVPTGYPSAGSWTSAANSISFSPDPIAPAVDLSLDPHAVAYTAYLNSILAATGWSAYGILADPTGMQEI